jgi:hypothetical protein
VEAGDTEVPQAWRARKKEPASLRESTVRLLRRRAGSLGEKAAALVQKGDSNRKMLANTESYARHRQGLLRGASLDGNKK